MAEGGYDPIAEAVFSGMNVDGFFLEFDSPRAGAFDPIRFVNEKKVAVLGLVTTKRAELESKDELKRQVEAATKFLPLERLALSPQCGFASGLEGNHLTVGDETRKLRLVVETAKQIWSR